MRRVVQVVISSEIVMENLTVPSRTAEYAHHPRSKLLTPLSLGSPLSEARPSMTSLCSTACSLVHRKRRGRPHVQIASSGLCEPDAVNQSFAVHAPF